ncbi:MAG TPA: hypothetical protein VGC82_07835, partial [Rhodopila sp.]
HAADSRWGTAYSARPPVGGIVAARDKAIAFFSGFHARSAVDGFRAGTGSAARCVRAFSAGSSHAAAGGGIARRCNTFRNRTWTFRNGNWQALPADVGNRGCACSTGTRFAVAAFAGDAASTGPGDAVSSDCGGAFSTHPSAADPSAAGPGNLGAAFGTPRFDAG